MTILRVFPGRTKATPRDSMCCYSEPGLFDLSVTDEVHISVTFSWHLKRAEELRKAWEQVCPTVKVGGPACGDPGGIFVRGRYLEHGHVITSRGCPNSCWFCDVPRREGPLRELPIVNGWKIQDSNLLACSREHIQRVFVMLGNQPNRPEFLGGLEADRLCGWHVEALEQLAPRRLFFAYDTPEDLEPLVRAGVMLRNIRCDLSCYVLIGFRGDTCDAAEQRCNEAIVAGFLPFAMLWRDRTGQCDVSWRRFQREWCRPAIVRAKQKCLKR